MCAAHRKEVLEEIRDKLKKNESVICVSTQLIEAGVDVSFECVMRSLAGLDSIAQAAGRCNRNGEVARRDVYVFNHAEENVTRLKTIEVGQECTRLMLLDLEKDPPLFNGELLSTDAMFHYFKTYYNELAPDLEYPVNTLNTTLYQMLFTYNKQFMQQSKPIQKARASLKTAAQHFQVIEGNTQAILVPYGERQELIKDLVSGQRIENYEQFLKKAQPYSVNVFSFEMKILQREQLVRIVDFGPFQLYIALDQGYDDQYGLTIHGDAGLRFMNF